MVKKVLLIAACVLAFTSIKTEADPKASEDVVATFNGTPITSSELEKHLHSSLMQIRQKEFEIKNSGLRELIFVKLQEIEAKKEGISSENYYKKNVTDKVSEPTDDEIKKVIEQYRDRLPKEADQARKRVTEFLKQQKMQQRDEAFKNELLAKAKIKIMLQPPREDIALEGHEPVLGPENAPVLIIEYSEFECPYCGKVQPTLKKIKEDYKGKIRFAFKNLPLDFHQHARAAAELALCANDQGKFWEMHDWLFDNKSKLGNMEEINNHAKELGIDGEKFSACIKEKTHADKIDKDMAVAEKLGVTATPTFFINGRLLQGAQPYEKFKEVIEQEIEFHK